MFSLQMRAVLVDWLVEVQVQFKLLQVMCTSYQSISQGDLTTTILMSCVTGDSVKRHLYRRPVPCRGGALGHEVQAAAGGRGRHVPGLQGGRSLRASMLYPLLAPVLQGWRRGRAAAQPGQVRHRARPRRVRPCASARVQVGRLCPLPVSCCWSPRFPFNSWGCDLIPFWQEKEATVWSRTLKFYSGFSKEDLTPTVSRLPQVELILLPLFSTLLPSGAAIWRP